MNKLNELEKHDRQILRLQNFEIFGRKTGNVLPGVHSSHAEQYVSAVGMHH